MDYEKILKVWGVRDRAYLSDKCEVDVLELLPHSNCSIHTHKYKSNKFLVIQGVVFVKTGFATVKLEKGDRLTVNPPLVHQFCTKENGAILLEIAFVTEGKIDSNDINRRKQGWRIINNKKHSVKDLEQGKINE